MHACMHAYIYIYIYTAIIIITTAIINIIITAYLSAEILRTYFFCRSRGPILRSPPQLRPISALRLWISEGLTQAES